MGYDAFEVLMMPACLVGAWATVLGLAPAVLRFFDRLFPDGVEQDEGRADVIGDSASRDGLARFGLFVGPDEDERRDETGRLPRSGGAIGSRRWM